SSRRALTSSRRNPGPRAARRGSGRGTAGSSPDGDAPYGLPGHRAEEAFRIEAMRSTGPGLGGVKGGGGRVTMVTAYDWTFARLLDAAGVELLLVGDSLGNVVQGHDTTLPVTLDEMVYHTRLVTRGARRALVVGDLPFGSYQSSPKRAVESAIRLVKEGGAAAVKLEGGLNM